MFINQQHNLRMQFMQEPELFSKLFLETSSGGSSVNYRITLSDETALNENINLILPKSCPTYSDQLRLSFMM